VQQIRKRLTYANVMSSIAIFLLLGGATALAAGLAKNSVGSKQLKKNAVTSAKIKKGAVTGAKVNVSGFPKVPSAASADNAAHATNADNAGNANTVAGNTIRKFFYASNTTTTKTSILSLDGLTLLASCEGGTPQLLATTSVPDVLVRAGGTFGFVEPFYVESDGLEPGEELNLLEEESDSVQGTLSYVTKSGGVVTGTFMSEEFGLESECVIAGHAIG
jgi:hypothetical protein